MKPHELGPAGSRHALSSGAASLCQVWPRGKAPAKTGTVVRRSLFLWPCRSPARTPRGSPLPASQARVLISVSPPQRGSPGPECAPSEHVTPGKSSMAGPRCLCRPVRQTLWSHLGAEPHSARHAPATRPEHLLPPLPMGRSAPGGARALASPRATRGAPGLNVSGMFAQLGTC